MVEDLPVVLRLDSEGLSIGDLVPVEVFVFKRPAGTFPDTVLARAESNPGTTRCTPRHTHVVTDTAAPTTDPGVDGN